MLMLGAHEGAYARKCLQHLVHESEIYWHSTGGCSIDDSEDEIGHL
jgi:hypothetical protein